MTQFRGSFWSRWGIPTRACSIGLWPASCCSLWGHSRSAGRLSSCCPEIGLAWLPSFKIPFPLRLTIMGNVGTAVRAVATSSLAINGSKLFPVLICSEPQSSVWIATSFYWRGLVSSLGFSAFFFHPCLCPWHLDLHPVSLGARSSAAVWTHAAFAASKLSEKLSCRHSHDASLSCTSCSLSGAEGLRCRPCLHPEFAFQEVCGWKSRNKRNWAFHPGLQA